MKPTSKKHKTTKLDSKDLFEMSDSDEEYFPDKEDLEVGLGKRKEFAGVSQKTKSMFDDMLKQSEAVAHEQSAMIAREKCLDKKERIEICVGTIGELAKRIKPTKEGLIHFAGKTYRLSDEGELVDASTSDVKRGFEELQQLAKKYTAEENTGKNSQSKVRNIEESEYRQLLKEKKANLKTLIGLLNNRHRNVSAIFKSRIDWKRYTTVNQLDKQLAQNRKDGFIEKQKFLVQSSTVQKKV